MIILPNKIMNDEIAIHVYAPDAQSIHCQHEKDMHMNRAITLILQVACHVQMTLYFVFTLNIITQGMFDSVWSSSLFIHQNDRDARKPIYGDSNQV